MKVAIVVANVAARYGGPAHAALAYAEALASVGVEVRVVTTDQDGPNRLAVPTRTVIRAPGGYDITYYTAGPRSRNRPWSPAFARGIDSAVAWADVVHVSSLYLPHNLYTYMSCLRWHTPYVVRPHGTLEPYQRRSSARPKQIFDWLVGNRYLARAHAFHFAGESEARHASDLVDSRRALVAPIPISMPPQPATVDRNHDVVFLGRIAAVKRLDLLLDAWPSISQAHPKSRLIVAGPFESDQRHLHVRALRTPGVDVVGLVTDEGKRRILADAAVFVLPSESENFGVALAEAMAYGVPVVTTSAVGLGGAVKTARAGEVLPSPTPQMLSASISGFLARPEARRRAGMAGRSLVEKSFSSRAIGIQLSDALSSAARTSHEKTLLA